MTSYWFINTDQDSVKGIRTCDVWFKHGMAFSGGDWEKFGLPLRDLRPLDTLLMYQNGAGIVGAGLVLETWDEQPHSDKLLYVSWDYSEYRIRVDWHTDLRPDPVDPRLDFGYFPRGFLRPIVKKKVIAEDLLSRLKMNLEFRSPEESGVLSQLQEGETRTVTVDVHERNPVARKQCIDYWGTVCQACGFAFHTMYGPIGQDYIHVHHLVPLQAASGPRTMDPINDLRPVCANCHAIIHKKHPPYSIEEVVAFIESQKKG